MIWTTVCNPAIDICYPVKDLSSATTFTDIATSMYPAGKGLNFAKVVRALGEEVSLIALMPEADSQRFAHYLTSHGIHFHFIAVPGACRINTTIYDTTSGLVQHFNSRGADCSTQIQNSFEKNISSLIVPGDFWALSGSLPKGIGPKLYGDMIRLCHERGVEVALDTRAEPLVEGVKQYPTILAPNSEELSLLYNEPLIGLQALLSKGVELLSKGIEMLFITLGEDGVLAFTEDTIYRCKAQDIDVVDTVGCGDAFLAGVVVAKVRGFSFKEICRLGVACGTANALNEGPGEIGGVDIASTMESVLIEELVFCS